MPESKSRRKKVIEAQQQRREFAGNKKRHPATGAPDVALEFGEWGEITPRTIQQAGMTKAEEGRVREMMKAQAAFLEIMDCLSYPVDPEGHIHDLSALGPTKNAIAWTLALNGFRRTAKAYIKRRAYPAAAGLYEDAHTWVDARLPDAAEDELQPEHKPNDPDLPPDTRRLAAIRDGDSPRQMPAGWKQKPKVIYVDEPRKET